jgi:arylsulfatase A-like enzyme
MGDHTRPVGAFELMMHIPLVFRHTGRIPSGRTSDLLVSNYDFLPGVLSHLGLSDKLPNGPPLPGSDFSAVLRGEDLKWDRPVLYEMETTRAIRTQDWKYVARHPDGPHELYDLRADPHERFNLYGQPRQTEVQKELAAKLESEFQKYVDPQYDLWRGGRSKAGRLQVPRAKPQE